MPEQALNPIAKELNDRLAKAAPEVLAMLSPLGRRLYFPRGILTQSAEAKEKGHRFNATIGRPNALPRWLGFSASCFSFHFARRLGLPGAGA